MISMLQIFPRITFRVFFCLAFACVIVSVHAHRSSDSYLTLRTEGSTVTGQWDIALRDIEHVIPLDANDDGNITWDEVHSRQSEIAEYAASHLQVRTGETILQMRVTELLVAEFLDEKFGNPHLQDCLARPDLEMGRCVLGDFRLPGVNFVPRDVAVVVRIEGNDVLDIAQCDVPLARDRRTFCPQSQVTVARPVGVNGNNDACKRQTKEDAESDTREDLEHRDHDLARLFRSNSA